MPKKTQKPKGKTATDPTLNLWRDHEPLQPSEIRPGALFWDSRRKAVVVAKRVKDDAILGVLLGHGEPADTFPFGDVQAITRGDAWNIAPFNIFELANEIRDSVADNSAVTASMNVMRLLMDLHSALGAWGLHLKDFWKENTKARLVVTYGQIDNVIDALANVLDDVLTDNDAMQRYLSTIPQMKSAAGKKGGA